MPDLPKPLYTLDEVASILDCKRTRLYELLTDKQIKAKKFGKRTLVTAESLHDFIANLPDAEIHMQPPDPARFDKGRTRETLHDLPAK
jgi:excisionase family DNA binding protein